VLIVSGQKPGLKDKDAVYALGMNAKDFRKQFGPPEREIESQESIGVVRRWQYLNDGLEVFVTQQGVIAAFTVYLIPSLPYQGQAFRAARGAQTDTGIASGASLRQIVKIHGEPSARTDIGAFMAIDYVRAGMAVSFRFNGGVLAYISLRNW
jgi:hypothetical protein